MTRSRRTAKQAGTSWESAIRDYLKERGWPHAERRARTGAKDQGDLTGVIGVCIEAKNTNRIELAGFLDQAIEEGIHARADVSAAWIKRRGKTSPEHGYVLIDGATFTRLLKSAGY